MTTPSIRSTRRATIHFTIAALLLGTAPAGLSHARMPAAPPSACVSAGAYAPQRANNWSFVMTFDDGTPNACLMASDKSLKVTAYEIPCRVSNVAISNGKAVFNGAGVIACPFGLGRYVPGLAATSTYSTPFLLEASLSGLGASTSLTVGNPLLTHPSARYFTPRGATPYAAGYPAYFTTITSAAQQSTLMGALLPATKVTVRSVHQCAQQACALTHRTKLGANAALKTTFNTAGPVLFANAETTVYIGYSPADGTHLTGTVDVIHWDPQAGKGN